MYLIDLCSNEIEVLGEYLEFGDVISRKLSTQYAVLVLLTLAVLEAKNSFLSVAHHHYPTCGLEDVWPSTLWL